MAINIQATSSLSIKVPDVPTDPSAWYVVSDLNYKPDRGDFLLKKFSQDFPNITLIKNGELDQLYALCSRSRKLSEWLAQANGEYVQTETVPTFYKNVLTPSQFEDAQKIVTRMSGHAKERAVDEANALKEYKAKLLEAGVKYSKSISAIPSNKQVDVLAINSTSLPLTIQLMIENYTPAAGAGAPDQKTYARELLIRYKVALLNIVKANPGINIATIIEEASLK